MIFFKKNKQKNIKKIISSFGYDVECGEKSMLYLSKEHAPLTSINVEENGSVWIMGFWTVNQTGAANHYELLQFLNELNSKSTIASFTYDGEGKTLIFHAVYTSKFSDDNFRTFLSNWENDVIHMLNYHPQTNTFLGDDGIDSSEPMKASA